MRLANSGGVANEIRVVAEQSNVNPSKMRESECRA
jgi:hypothetical protein